MKIGSLVSHVATPITRMFGADCYDPITQDLKPNSPCGKARTGLDNARTLKDVGQVIFERFSSNQTKGDKMEKENKVDDGLKDFILVVLVKATDAVQAGTKMSEGKVLAINPQRPDVRTSTPPRPSLTPVQNKT